VGPGRPSPAIPSAALDRRPYAWAATPFVRLADRAGVAGPAPDVAEPHASAPEEAGMRDGRWWSRHGPEGRLRSSPSCFQADPAPLPRRPLRGPAHDGVRRGTEGAR